MNECREFWRYEGKQDRPIIVNHKGILIDGYAMYLVLLEHKEEIEKHIEHMAETVKPLGKINSTARHQIAEMIAYCIRR